MASDQSASKFLDVGLVRVELPELEDVGKRAQEWALALPALNTKGVLDGIEPAQVIQAIRKEALTEAYIAVERAIVKEI